MTATRKTNTAATLASIVLFLAMAAYLGVYIARSARERVQTSMAVSTTVTDSVEASGFIVREETVLQSGREFIYLDAEDGERVAAGSVIARATDSREELATASRASELQSEIYRMRTLLSDMSDAASITERGAAIRSAVSELAGCVATGDLSALESAAVSLRSLVFTDGAGGVTQADLAALEGELAALNASGYGGAEDIKAPDSGLFTTLVDGHESLTPESLKGMTPTEVATLAAAPAEESTGAIGKIVTGFRWYYACCMDESAAAKLSTGSYASLSLGKRYGGAIRARVDYISPPENRLCAVVFSSITSMAETLASRSLDVSIVFSEQTGLRVPVKALHVNAEGDTFVYVVTAQRVERKIVEILEKTDDYYLVAIDDAPDALRAGNEIITGGKAVTEGMYLE